MWGKEEDTTYMTKVRRRREKRKSDEMKNQTRQWTTSSTTFPQLSSLVCVLCALVNGYGCGRGLVLVWIRYELECVCGLCVWMWEV